MWLHYENFRNTLILLPSFILSSMATTKWGSQKIEWHVSFTLRASLARLLNYLFKLNLRELRLSFETLEVLADTSSMFKNSYLDVSNFGFLSFCPFSTKNAIFTFE